MVHVPSENEAELMQYVMQLARTRKLDIDYDVLAEFVVSTLQGFASETPISDVRTELATSLADLITADGAASLLDTLFSTVFDTQSGNLRPDLLHAALSNGSQSQQQVPATVSQQTSTSIPTTDNVNTQKSPTKSAFADLQKLKPQPQQQPQQQQQQLKQPQQSEQAIEEYGPAAGTMQEYNDESVTLTDANGSIGGMVDSSSLCRGYMERGYCVRGPKCRFIHEPTPVEVHKLPELSYFLYRQHKQQEARRRSRLQAVQHGTVLGNTRNVSGGGPALRGRMRTRGGFGGVSGSPYNSATGGSNAHGPHGTTTATAEQTNSIIVTNVPESELQIGTINDFFAVFGAITNITVDRDTKRATVQFADSDGAQRAYSSATPVFGDRDVKVVLPRVADRVQAATAATHGPGSSITGSLVPRTVDVAAMSDEQRAAREAMLQRAQANLAQLEDTRQRQRLEQTVVPLEQALRRKVEEHQALLRRLTDPALAPQDKATLFKQAEVLSASISSGVASVQQMRARATQ